MANPCATKNHTMRTFRNVAGGWGVADKISLGCVEKPLHQRPPLANPDLREMDLPDDWDNMIDIRLTQGNTTHLPDHLPTNLTTLDIDHNALVEVPALPANLEFLVLSHNQLRALPTLPARLRNLRVDHNQLTKLPFLPASVRRLKVDHNQLTELPSLPAGLSELKLSHNNLESIPSLAATQLMGVGLGFNQLKTLPALPATLRDLSCPNNQLTAIRDLPASLRVLICNNNQLDTLQIDNLAFLRLVVANNCGLSYIPLLPTPPADDEEREDYCEYYFEGNPLTPEFQAIYERFIDNYNQDGGAMVGGRGPSRGRTKRFREEVLAEHRRILRERGASLGALRQVFKGPMTEETPELTRKAVQGNFGPTNLIASFITGLPGTLESQRLGVLEQREQLGNVPVGTAAAARDDIANVAVGRDPVIGPPTRQQNILAKRAKLYVRPENIQVAKAQFEVDIERCFEEMRIADVKKEHLRVYGNLVYEISVVEKKALHEEESMGHYDVNDRFVYDLHEYDIKQMTSEVKMDMFRTFLGDNNAALQNKAVRKYAHIHWKLRMLDELDIRKPTKGDILENAAIYPQWFTEPRASKFLQEELELIDTISNLLFPDELSEEDVRQRKEAGSAFYKTLLALLQKFNKNLEPVSPNLAPVVANLNPQDNAAIDAVEEAVNAALDINNAANFVQVVNNNNVNDEALAHVMAQIQAVGNINNNQGNNQGGGRRRHRTPRKHKSKRQTRKH